MGVRLAAVYPNHDWPLQRLLDAASGDVRIFIRGRRCFRDSCSQPESANNLETGEVAAHRVFLEYSFVIRCFWLPLLAFSESMGGLDASLTLWVLAGFALQPVLGHGKAGVHFVDREARTIGGVSSTAWSGSVLPTATNLYGKSAASILEVCLLDP